MKLGWHVQNAGVRHGFWRMYAIQTTLRSKKIQKKKGMIIGTGFSARSTGDLSVLSTKCLRGSTPVFLSGFNFFAFSVFGYDHRAPEVLNQWFPYPRRTAFLDCRAPSTRSRGLWSASFRLLPFSGFELDLVVSGCLRCMPRKRILTCMSLSLLSPQSLYSYLAHICWLYFRHVFLNIF